MDSSWIEVLPLPKSRPGWVAAILLFVLVGMPIFLYIQPQLAERGVIEIDSNKSFSHNGIEGISQLVYPRFLSPDSVIPITFRISSIEKPTLQIQSISVVWTCRFYSNGQLLLNNNRNGATKDLSIASNEARINFQMPNCVMDETDEIQGSFSIVLAGSNERVDVSNNVIIELNRWKVVTTSVLNVLAPTRNGLIVIAILSLISVWLVENKKHQNVWLDSREGWSVARRTFVRALSRFLIILTVLITLLASNDPVGKVIGVILLFILLVWLFLPNLQASWIKLRNRLQINAQRNRSNGKIAKAAIENHPLTCL